MSKSKEVDLEDPTLHKALANALQAGRERQKTDLYEWLITEMAIEGEAIHLMNIGKKIFMFKNGDMVYVPILNLEPSEE